MAQRQIIILQRTLTADNNPQFGYILRADVPAARQPYIQKFQLVPNQFVPVPPDVDPDANAISTGAVVEKTGDFVNDGTLTIGQIQATLIRLQQDFQAAVTNQATYSRYSSFFDGNAWTLRGA